jgi:hypothetical protein
MGNGNTLKYLAGFQIWRCKPGEQRIKHDRHSTNQIMKKSNLYIIALTVAVGAFGVTALTPKLTAADGTMGSCCGGMSMSMCGGTSMSMPPTPTVDAKAQPDLMTNCPVSGKKLGDMGKPLVFTYKGQEVKLCCTGCKKDFDKNAEKIIAEIRAADKK